MRCGFNIFAPKGGIMTFVIAVVVNCYGEIDYAKARPYPNL
jgi:hypothetical protein